MTTLRSRSRKAALAAAALAGLGLASWLAAGCEKESPAGTPMTLAPTIEIVARTGCKTGIESGRAGSLALDCVEYGYGDDGVLLLTHANAAFNCCIDDVAAAITVSGDTIRILESEIVTTPCHCLCLYDVDYRIEGLLPGVYTIVVVEPYTAEGDSLLAGAIDLVTAPAGSFCAVRDHYPWIEDTTPAEPQGRIVGVLGCDAQITPAAGTGAWPDMSCAEWRYVRGNVLSIAHEHAGFNCCAREIAADIFVENGVVTIVEREDSSPCDCSCLWSVYYEIVDVPPGTYEVRFVEPYRHSDDEPLDFTIDLAGGPAEGVSCADRMHYPWRHERTEQEDWRALDLARRAILDYVGEAPCAGNGECRYIAFGDKPCGGPWSYIVYSTANVDEAALRRVVDWYNAWNGVLNRRYSTISDCSIPPVPAPGCMLGKCIDTRLLQR